MGFVLERIENFVGQEKVFVSTFSLFYNLYVPRAPDL